jgi:hypothetical protein
MPSTCHHQSAPCHHSRPRRSANARLLQGDAEPTGRAAHEHASVATARLKRPGDNLVAGLTTLTARSCLMDTLIVAHSIRARLTGDDHLPHDTARLPYYGGGTFLPRVNVLRQYAAWTLLHTRRTRSLRQRDVIPVASALLRCHRHQRFSRSSTPSAGRCEVTSRVTTLATARRPRSASR